MDYQPYSCPQITLHYTGRDSILLPRLVRLITPAPSPCKVLRSSRDTLSQPLSQFVYDYREGVFRNGTGYTWTPALFKSLNFSLPTEQNAGLQPEEQLGPNKKRALMLLCPSSSKTWKTAAKRDKGEEPPKKRVCIKTDESYKKQISYSRFMLSPYLVKKKWESSLLPTAVTARSTKS